MKLWIPPSHRVFMSNSTSLKATPITNTLFGAFFLALDRQQLPPGDGMWVGEGVAITDPAVVECVLRHWMLGDSSMLLQHPSESKSHCS